MWHFGLQNYFKFMRITTITHKKVKIREPGVAGLNYLKYLRIV